MIVTRQAEGDNVAHKVEILCPSCNKDVDAAELAAKKCDDCGHDLSQPKQSVEVHATSVPTFAITF